MVGGGVDPLPILLRCRRSLTPFAWGFSQVLFVRVAGRYRQSELVRKSDRTGVLGYSGLIFPCHADGVVPIRCGLCRAEYLPPLSLGLFPEHD